jgi:hypothetical protein
VPAGKPTGTGSAVVLTEKGGIDIDAAIVQKLTAIRSRTRHAEEVGTGLGCCRSQTGRAEVMRNPDV